MIPLQVQTKSWDYINIPSINFLSSDLIARNNNTLFYGDLFWDRVTIYEK